MCFPSIAKKRPLDPWNGLKWAWFPPVDVCAPSDGQAVSDKSGNGRDGMVRFDDKRQLHRK